MKYKMEIFYFILSLVMPRIIPMGYQVIHVCIHALHILTTTCKGFIHVI